MFSSMLSLLGSLRGGSSFITRSLRFRSSASAFLNRTFTAPTDRNKWTWSAWVKRGLLSANGTLLATQVSADNFIYFSTDNTLLMQTAATTRLQTSQVFRDISAWYHLVVVYDAANPTANLRIRFYINGVEPTSYTIDARSGVALNQGQFNTAVNHFIGSGNGALDGYLTDVNFIDGQALTPASFGAIDSSTGVWAPRPYSGTYGTNGFYLKFGNTSSVSALGTDSSGNGNTWTVNNVSLTAGATYDSMLDVPVNYADGGNGRGNYCTLNPLSTQGTSTGITNGNLSVTFGSAANRGASGNMFVSSGKWYFEFPAIGSGATDGVGVISDAATFVSGYTTQGVIYYASAQKNIDGTTTSYGATYTAGDIIGVALDNDSGSIIFYKNNVSQGTISLTLRNYTAAFVTATGISSGPFNMNFGQRPFTYTPPAGFRALNTNNLPTPSIVNGANFMAATTYTGNAAARSLSNAVNSVSFQPDLVWIKSRTPGATSHALFDSTRGTTKYLSSNTTTAETTLAQSLTAFGADGFSLGTDTTLVNANANSYVAWQWRESVTAGLDVVTYTGTGVARTVAHNLGKKPSLIICKGRDTLVPWECYHSSLGATKYILLNTPGQANTDIVSWNNTEPTSSVFTVGASSGTNKLNENTVAYCFAEIAGFSKFGSYTGNGLADGPFVFCGFRPRFVMIKRTDVAASWVMFDSSRNPSNLTNLGLIPNDPAVEFTGTGTSLDILSNGIKARGAGAELNVSAATYIFAAFAEVPSKYALAR